MISLSVEINSEGRKQVMSERIQFKTGTPYKYTVSVLIKKHFSFHCLICFIAMYQNFRHIVKKEQFIKLGVTTRCMCNSCKVVWFQGEEER
jgi:hypothetical protein